MMTVISPGSTPSIVYNRDGQTIDNIAAGGTNQATATPIVRYCWYTIVIVSGSGSPVPGIRLPDDSDIGDVIEIHGNGSCALWPESGGQIDSGGANSEYAQQPMKVLLRRISSGNWATISNTNF
jgi:hypothetical protein